MDVYSAISIMYGEFTLICCPVHLQDFNANPQAQDNSFLKNYLRYTLDDPISNNNKTCPK
jgi:hypothetical protein